MRFWPPRLGARSGGLMNRLERGLIWPTVVLGVFLLLVLAVLLGGCEKRIIFQPMKYPGGLWDTESFGFPVEDVNFASADGTKLHGWYVSRPDARGTLLWCHGNAGNLSHRADNIARLMTLPLNVFIFDYRGYGKSEGEPDEAGLYQDALAAYDVLVRDKGQKPETLILFGRSLGGAAAVHVATHRKAAGLILESAFTSARDMAKKVMPLIPGGLLSARLDILGPLAALKMPTLILHGDRDEVVPFEMGEALFRAANEPKTFYVISGAGHNDTYFLGGKPYYAAWKKFIGEVLPPPAP